MDWELFFIWPGFAGPGLSWKFQELTCWTKHNINQLIFIRNSWTVRIYCRLFLIINTIACHIILYCKTIWAIPHRVGRAYPVFFCLGPCPEFSKKKPVSGLRQKGTVTPVDKIFAVCSRPCFEIIAFWHRWEKYFEHCN